MNTGKPLAATNADNVLRQAFNKEDASVTVNGFLAGRDGRRITLEMPSVSVEVWRMYEKVTNDSVDITGANVSNISSNVINLIEVGQHVLTTYTDYDITVLSVDRTAGTAVLSATPATTGVGVTANFNKLLFKYQLTYDSGAKENLMDAERVG